MFCSSVGSVLAMHALGPGFDSQHYINMLIMLRHGGSEVNASSSRPVLAT